MPVYTFECEHCRKQEDKRLPISLRDEPLSLPCEVCGGKVKRIITSAPKIVAGVTVTDKRPEGWKDVLRGIKKNSGKTNCIDV